MCLWLQWLSENQIRDSLQMYGAVTKQLRKCLGIKEAVCSSSTQNFESVNMLYRQVLPIISRKKSDRLYSGGCRPCHSGDVKQAVRERALHSFVNLPLTSRSFGLQDR